MKYFPWDKSKTEAIKAQGPFRKEPISDEIILKDLQKVINEIVKDKYVVQQKSENYEEKK